MKNRTNRRYSNGKNYNPRKNWNSRSRRSVKTIDPNLFVNKAQPQAESIFVPKNSFSDFNFASDVKRAVEKRGYTTPTPIQDKGIPMLLEGKDIIGIANTGTGKTATFLLPLINKVYKNRQEKVLVIAPTRELAIQIEDEFKAFAKYLRLYSVVCIGGAPMYKQIRNLRRNSQFVIGTPGRLQDLERRNEINFKNYRSIVLDEVDRMLDMGFVNEMKYIISKLPQDRQSLFFSATFPEKLQPIAKSFLTNPITVSVKQTNTSKNVDQDVVKVGNKAKIEVLHDLLIQDDFRKVLVFGRTKRGVDRLNQDLDKRGFKIASIHGDKSQNQRQRALDKFKQNKVQILLATDVAARGLDINNVSHVINYDQPETYEDYVHRIGRTGRANKTGVALTFVN